MKTLITGGTGLVGSAVDGDVRLSTKDGDLRDWNQTLELFEFHKPEGVIHFENNKLCWKPLACYCGKIYREEFRCRF